MINWSKHKCWCGASALIRLLVRQDRHSGNLKERWYCCEDHIEEVVEKM